VNGKKTNAASYQARNQLGTPGGAKTSERDQNFLTYVQHTFPWRRKIFSGGHSSPLVTDLPITISFLSISWFLMAAPFLTAGLRRSLH